MNLPLPLLFGAILAGALVIDYGIRSARDAFASAGTGGGGGSSPNLAPGQYTAPIDPSVNPRKSRTDMGVDVSAPPGTPIRAIGKSRVVGILQGWYHGQPFVWFQLLDGPDAGKYWYAAEQLTPTVKPGDVLQAGEQFATVAPTGTALEFGWAVSDGRTLAQATTGYVEGQVTSAGQDFERLLTTVGL